MENFAEMFNMSDSPMKSLTNDQLLSYMMMLCIALLFGLVLHFLYSVYFRETEPTDASLSRSLVLLTPSLMTIFWFV